MEPSGLRAVLFGCGWAATTLAYGMLDRWKVTSPTTVGNVESCEPEGPQDSPESVDHPAGREGDVGDPAGCVISNKRRAVAPQLRRSRTMLVTSVQSRKSSSAGTKLA